MWFGLPTADDRKFDPHSARFYWNPTPCIGDLFENATSHNATEIVSQNPVTINISRYFVQNILAEIEQNNRNMYPDTVFHYVLHWKILGIGEGFLGLLGPQHSLKFNTYSRKSAALVNNQSYYCRICAVLETVISQMRKACRILTLIMKTSITQHIFYFIFMINAHHQPYASQIHVCLLPCSKSKRD